MSEEHLKRAWMKIVAEAVTLGPTAIRDQMMLASSARAAIGAVDVLPLGDRAYKVKVRYTPTPLREYREVEIAVRDNLPRDRDYSVYEEFIRNRQKEMPAHLAGRTHNVDQFMYDKILELVRRATGYEGLYYGDLWVHSCDTLDEAKGAQLRGEGAQEGMVCFGYLTRAGEIAMNKFFDVSGMRTDEPVYAG